MNLSKLQSSKGARLRLVPPATVARVEGGSEERDDLWLLSDVSLDCVQLVNERTHQHVALSPDHVHSYTSSPPGSNFAGSLELKVTIDITSLEPAVRIIPSGAAKNIVRESGQPLRVRLKLLLDRVNPDILRTATSSRGPIAVMMGAENLQLLNQLRHEPGFNDLIVVRSNGNVCMGSGNRISGHIHDCDALGSLHGVLLEIQDSLA